MPEQTVVSPPPLTSASLISALNRTPPKGVPPVLPPQAPDAKGLRALATVDAAVIPPVPGSIAETGVADTIIEQLILVI